MARPKQANAQRKPWRPLKEWVPHEWATMHEAWSRVYASLSNNMPLTRRDLKADLLAGRLVGAARVVNKKDGTEWWMIFERDFWKPVEFPYAWNVTGYDEHYREGEEWHFFVHRRELDQRYPVAASAEQTEPQQPTQPQRRRGPPPEHEWPMEVARELIQLARAGQPMPTAPEMLDWCRDKWDWEPDIRQMQILLRKLLSS